MSAQTEEESCVGPGGEGVLASFINRLRGYQAVLGSVRSLTDDICVDCIMLQGTQKKLTKHLGKLTQDLEGSTLALGEKERLKGQAEALMAQVGRLSPATEFT